jgi:hypothetical protein
VIRKRKIPWATVVFSAVIGLPLSYWTYTMVQDGFVWYAIFPGAVAAFFVIGGLAVLFTGDDSAPEEEGSGRVVVLNGPFVHGGE